MKVFSQPAGVSALDTWLRDIEVANATRDAASTISGHSAAASEDHATQPRDTAEALLVLNVWNETAAGTRTLAATETVAQAAANPVAAGSVAKHSATAGSNAADSVGTAEHWAEHILSPLL
jgi:hypothetical protein